VGTGSRHLSATVLCILATVVASAAAEVYQWRDAQGTVHFADNPPSYPADVTTLDADSGQPVVPGRQRRMRASARDDRDGPVREPSAISVSPRRFSSEGSSMRHATDGSSTDRVESSAPVLETPRNYAQPGRGFSLLGGRGWGSEAPAQRRSVLDEPSELNLPAPPVRGHLTGSRSVEEPRGILDGGGEGFGAGALEDGSADDGDQSTAPVQVRRRAAYSILIPSDGKSALPTRRPQAVSPASLASRGQAPPSIRPRSQSKRGCARCAIQRGRGASRNFADAPAPVGADGM
jgi:hypothetical protein